jgi:hypothetical protein
MIAKIDFTSSGGNSAAQIFCACSGFHGGAYGSSHGHLVMFFIK